MSRVTNDLQQVRGLLGFGVLNLFNTAFGLVSALGQAGGSLELRRGGGNALEGQGHTASWGWDGPDWGDWRRPVRLGNVRPFWL